MRARLAIPAVLFLALPLTTGCRIVGAAVDTTFSVADAAIDTTFHIVDGTIDTTMNIVDGAADVFDDDDDTIVIVHDCHPGKHPPRREPCGGVPAPFVEEPQQPAEPRYAEDPSLPPPTPGREPPERLTDMRPGDDPLAFLGVKFASPEGSERWDVSPRGDGVRIDEIIAGSAAARAGLRAGDVITSAGGIAVRNPEDLTLAIRVRDVGESVEIGIRRDGAELLFTVRLGFRSRPM